MTMRVCNGCRQIATTTRGYCDNCKPAQNHRRNERPLHKIHVTAAWRKARARVLTRDEHTCVKCGAHANTVHITDYTDPFNIDLLESLCASCHGRIDGRRSHLRTRAQQRVQT